MTQLPPLHTIHMTPNMMKVIEAMDTRLYEKYPDIPDDMKASSYYDCLIALVDTYVKVSHDAEPLIHQTFVDTKYFLSGVRDYYLAAEAALPDWTPMEMLSVPKWLLSACASSSLTAASLP